MTVDELLEEFSRFESDMLESSNGLQELEGTGEIPDVFEAVIIDWSELEKIDKGIELARFNSTLKLSNGTPTNPCASLFLINLILQRGFTLTIAQYRMYYQLLYICSYNETQSLRTRFPF
jgi:hypothetical protein